jgi:hypothetical protein
MKSKFVAGALAGALMVFVVAPFASAATILDTTNGAFSNPSSGSSVANTNFFRQAVAVPFTIGSAATITDVAAYIGLDTFLDLGGASVDIGIMADASSIPSGTFLFHQIATLSTSNPVTLSSLTWSIGSGSYWLAAFATLNSYGIWDLDEANVQPFATFANTWTPHTQDGVPQARILGDFADTVTPLPGALPLFAGGLSALGLLGWRRKRKHAV